MPGEVRFQALARAEAKGGTVRVEGGTLVVEGVDEVTLLISMGSSYRSYKDVGGDPAQVAGRHLTKAGGRPYEVLEAQARPGLPAAVRAGLDRPGHLGGGGAAPRTSASSASSSTRTRSSPPCTSSTAATC
ncbi:hypothetical protein GCM10020220_008020 [Nonomuraea rubra]|uniref:hypothetical protein n=1 Tax=Nonomuraea rubra TaxID=46180 RepID=UPI00338C14A2